MGTQSSHDYTTRLAGERAALEALAAQYKQEVELLPLGTAGYVAKMEVSVTSHRVWQGPAGTDPVIAIDADDSILAYNKAREPRMDLFSDFVADELGHTLDRHTLNSIMDMTDTFSRWEDWGIDSSLYHIDAHMWTLEWAIAELHGVPAGDIPTKLDELGSTLEGIRAGLGSEVADAREPFSFERDELVLGTFAPTGKVASIFGPMHDTELYEDALIVVEDLAAAGSRAVIFTYGEPHFQLHKVFRLRERLIAAGHGWPYEYVFLTKKRKGEFIKDMFALVPREAGLMRNLFSNEPHIFMLIDDDKKEVDDFVTTGLEVEWHSGARMCAVHTLREGAKTWKKYNEVFRDHPEGRTVHESDRHGVFLHSVTEDLHPHLPEGAKRVHQAAYANLELRVCKVLDRNLTTLVDKATDTETKVVLQSQRQYATSRVDELERAIEEAHGTLS